MKEHLKEEKEKNKPNQDDDEDTKEKKKQRNNCIDAIIEALDSVEFDEYNPETLVKDMVDDFNKNPKKYNQFKNGTNKKCADIIIQSK